MDPSDASLLEEAQQMQYQARIMDRSFTSLSSEAQRLQNQARENKLLQRIAEHDKNREPTTTTFATSETRTPQVQARVNRLLQRMAEYNENRKPTTPTSTTSEPSATRYRSVVPPSKHQRNHTFNHPKRQESYGMPTIDSILAGDHHRSTRDILENLPETSQTAIKARILAKELEARSKITKRTEWEQWRTEVKRGHRLVFAEAGRIAAKETGEDAWENESMASLGTIEEEMTEAMEEEQETDRKEM